MKRAFFAFALLAALVPFRVGSSSATFVAASANPNTTFSTASDFNTVAVALTDPGSPLRATVALAATAASDRGITSVRFQSAPAGTSTWTDACTDSAAPFTCDFDTTKVADGLRDVRALALDAAGYTRTSVVASRRIDNTAPATSLTDPGTPLTGTKTLNATATDGGSGVASVALQYRTSGAWTTICAATSCAFDTTSLPDGLYDLRSLVTDRAGNTATSVVMTRIDNTAPTVSVSVPTPVVRDTTTMTATVDDGAGTGVSSVRFQVRPSSTGVWIDVCTASAAPFTCTADTTIADDGLYDARAIATDGAGLSTTSAIFTGRIDNTAPSSATLTDPGSPLQGTVNLGASAADTGSGIASVRIERATAGTSTWTEICTDNAAPFTCAWNTAAVADGRYDLRAVATDVAGNTRTSATVANRRVDDSGPTAVLNDPGAVRGSATLTATATDPAGVASVTIQRKSGANWTTICTDSSAPYTCTWNTGLHADGTYELRATALDTLGRGSTSASVSARVDNTAPTATGVQAVNGGGTAGRIDAGDVLTFTYSEALAPGSLLAGWTGASIAVNVRVTDAGALDTLSIWDAANSTKVALTGNDLRLLADRTTGGARLAGTMVLNGNQVVITLGAVVTGSTRTATGASTMLWAPSTAATDLAGNPVPGTSVLETGSTDTDF